MSIQAEDIEIESSFNKEVYIHAEEVNEIDSSCNRIISIQA